MPTSGHGRKPMVNRMAVVKLQISSKCTSHSIARTEALLKSSSEINSMASKYAAERKR